MATVNLLGCLGLWRAPEPHPVIASVAATPAMIPAHLGLLSLRPLNPG
jgi:hypothetical protein